MFNNQNLLPLSAIIRIASEQSIYLGKGKPENRIAYFVKTGLIPHAIRKKNPQTGKIESHFPVSVLQEIQKINQLKKQGRSVSQLANGSSPLDFSLPKINNQGLKTNVRLLIGTLVLLIFFLSSATLYLAWNFSPYPNDLVIKAQDVLAPVRHKVSSLLVSFLEDELKNTFVKDRVILSELPKDLILNLNATYLQGKEPGLNSGNIPVFSEGGIIVGLNIATSNLIDSSVSSAKLADNSVTSQKIKDGEVTSADIANGTIKGEDIADNTISDGKLAQITSSNKVAGSAVQLSSSGGLVDSSGLSLLTTCSSNQILAWNGSAWACAAQSGGGGGGVTSLDALTGILTIANTSGSVSTITIDNAAADGSTKGIAAFNSTNFTASSGVINTIQNIATTSSPTFASGTVLGSQTFTANNILDSGALTIKTTTTGALTLDTGTTGIVNIGTGTSGKTINIGTDNTNKDTINIGSALDDVAITGDQWSVTNAGVLTVASCTGCGGGGATLQTAYNTASGNTITTTDARNVIFTLAEVTTPTSFTIENQDTAGVSAERIFNSIASGTLTNGLLVEQTGIGTMTNGINITQTAGTVTNGLTFTGTFGTNLISAANFTVTNAGAVILAGAQTKDITTAAAGTSTALVFAPGDSTTISGTGSSLTLRGSNQTGTTSIGGNLVLQGGTGTTTNGIVQIGTANTSAITLGATGILTTDPGSLTVTQTLTANTLSSSGVTITGGTINGTTIGATTPSTGAFTTVSATGQITSTLVTGTAPFVVASTTNVANLNASSLNGATFAAPGAIGSGTPSTGAFTTLSASSSTVTLSGLGANSGTSLCLNGTTVVTCTAGSSAATLQSAYNAGNTITTTDARNIAFTFADTATDTSLTLTQQGTAATLIMAEGNVGAGGNGFTSSTTFNGASGIGTAYQQTLTDSTSSTGGFSALQITDSAGTGFGSGNKRLLDLQVGSTASFFSSNGALIFGSVNRANTDAFNLISLHSGIYLYKPSPL